MKYLSVCSGIEAATQAWHPMGWQPVAFSEIEPFPCAVLKHHYPTVPNWGDMTKFAEWPDADIDVLCGGTPCQSFSVAGLRKGLDDPRGNLMLTYGGIAKRYRPQWLVWENVPGVLSSNGGRDFGTFLWMLGQLGYGWAYRILDAQHVRTCRFPFAVPQRRRRVFVVGYLGDWRRAAAVLFDRESLSGHPAPRRKAGQIPAAFTSSSFGGYSEGVGTLRSNGGDLGGGSETLIAAAVAPTLNAHFGEKQGLENQHIDGGGACSSPPVANPLTARMHKGVNTTLDEGQTLIINGGGFDVSPIAYRTAGDGAVYEEGAVTAPLTTGSDSSASIIVQPIGAIGDPAFTLQSSHSHAVITDWQVRRLTPRECERLMGFPDDFTAIPWRGKPAELCPDGPRYKALGNSWSVNCADWIGERIAEVDQWGEYAQKGANHG